MKRTIEKVPEIAYSIPYEWGQLSVSKQADELYGLTPFTATIEGSNVDDAPRPKDGPAAYLTLVGPREYGFAPVKPTKGPRTDRVASLNLALPVTRDSMIGQLTDEIGFIRENIDEDIDEVLLGEDGGSLEETLGNEVPQQIAHLLSAYAGQRVSEAITQRDLELYDNKISGYVRTLGLFGVATTVSLIELSQSIVPNHPGLMVGVTVGGAIGISKFGGNSIKHLLQTRDILRNGPFGDLFGRQVAIDIHASYCRSVFDSAEEDML